MIPNANVRGDIYECLLSKLATAGVNGKFRTPRYIIRIMVDIMVPWADRYNLCPGLRHLRISGGGGEAPQR